MLKETDAMVVQTHKTHMFNKKSELSLRIISSMIFGPLFLYTSLKQGIAFSILIAILLILSLREWHVLAYKNKNTDKQNTLYLGGIFYLFVCFFSMFKIVDTKIIETPFWVFCLTVWSFDSFAYFTGKIIKGPKLCPTISPSKTWSGFIGGTLISFICYIGLIHLATKQTIKLNHVFIGLLLPLSAQFGDLLESKIKRILKVKDSGNMIPGHGGILDRFDGMLFSALCFYIFYFFISG